MEKLKKQIENILLEAWHGISDFKSDGREFPRSDKISEYTDKIIEEINKSRLKRIKLWKNKN